MSERGPRPVASDLHLEGINREARAGASSNPPATVPQYMAVIASSSITKSGSTIAGDTTDVVVVKTNPGYGPDPGNAGTGTVVAAEVCGS
jgi:hypothetical protein